VDAVFDLVPAGQAALADPEGVGEPSQPRLRRFRTAVTATSATGSAIKIRVGGVGVAIGTADLDLADLVARE